MGDDFCTKASLRCAIGMPKLFRLDFLSGPLNEKPSNDPVDRIDADAPAIVLARLVPVRGAGRRGTAAGLPLAVARRGPRPGRWINRDNFGDAVCRRLSGDLAAVLFARQRLACGACYPAPPGLRRWGGS